MNDLIPVPEPVGVDGRVTSPCREWLVRCFDSGTNLASCAIEANAGTITVVGPRAERLFTLDRSDIATFQDAFRAAIAQANADYAEGWYTSCA